jgi:hypothetical protein
MRRVVLALLWWIIVAGMVAMIDPGVIRNIPFSGSYGLFFLSLGLAIWSSAALIWGNYRRATLTTVVILGFLILRLIKLGYWLNGVLLVGLAIVIDSVFTKRV